MTTSPPTHKPVNPPRAYIAVWDAYEGTPDLHYEIPPAITFETSDPRTLRLLRDILCGTHPEYEFRLDPNQQPLVTRMDTIE
jgi:hypothetical protein